MGGQDEADRVAEAVRQNMDRIKAESAAHNGVIRMDMYGAKQKWQCGDNHAFETEHKGK